MAWKVGTKSLVETEEVTLWEGTDRHLWSVNKEMYPLVDFVYVVLTVAVEQMNISFYMFLLA